MSSATEKNAQALKALFGSAALVDRLTATRISVVTPTEALPYSGILLAEVVADVLARLWPNIDFVGGAAEMQFSTAVAAATSGGGTGEGLAVRWSPPYDCVVAIGCDVPPGCGEVLRVGADGWVAELGPEASCGDNTNPVGPAFAAALAGAQVFRRVFSAELSDTGTEPIDSCSVDVRIVSGIPDVEPFEIDLGESHFFGVGAVTHGLMWLLEHWPARVLGRANLVDQDKYGFSNGQRYTFMRPHHDGIAKVLAMAERLRAAHASLEVFPHEVDLNTYCALRGYSEPMQRIIAGLDSAEARRHAALKLPQRAINMWTEGVRVGAARYLPGGASACLACDYLEDASSPLDEVAQISRQTGLRPDAVRFLLDSACGLRADEASALAARWSVSPDILVGQPLRSVLPVLCAMGHLQMGKHDESVDVPFAFASSFAGIAGFMMLLKDVMGTGPSEGWTQHVFKAPTLHMHSLRHPRMECVCCAEFALD